MTSIRSILVRYSLLVIVGALFFVGVLYKALLPLTLYPSYFILGLFHEALAIDNLIVIGNTVIEIIPACVAVSAYFLLAALTLATPMAPKKALKAFFFLFLLFLGANIIRIVILSSLYLSGAASFTFVHTASWYLLSIILVLGAWFLAVTLFNIKEIPAYSDILFLLRKRQK